MIMKNRFVQCVIFALSLSAPGFCDGWSESGLTFPVKIETVTVKDNGAVIVGFVGLNRLYYFDNRPQLLSAILSAKAAGSSVRAWTKTNPDYNTSDLPPGGVALAHYLGAIQVQP